MGYAQISLDEGESVFLIPDADELERVEDYIDEHFDMFFTAILGMHAGHAEQWPAPRTARMFHAWFRVRVHSLVFDLDPSPLIYG